MTPYYDDGVCQIYHGDCMELLPTLRCVDLVLTSPPFNLDDEGRATDGTAFRHFGYGECVDALPHKDYVEWQRAVLTACWNVLANDGAIFYNHKPRVRGNHVSLPIEFVPRDLPIRQIIIWDRGSGFNRQRTYFVPAHEWVLLIARDQFRLNECGGPDDVWRLPFEANTLHPAPFPLSLARLAIGCTSATWVLDPFMGSGTTLRAAKDLNRSAIGIEIEERYCEIAAKRLAQEVLDFGSASTRTELEEA